MFLDFVNMSQDNEERRRKAMETLSLQIDKYPRDLLRTFMSRDNTQQSESSEPEGGGGSEEIELNLGLSLGGRFGVDKHAKKLGRSSSIVGTMPLGRENESTTPPTPSYPALLRTSSLPTETEEEWRKRKELQMLRRMEAKRRRSEKQRNSRTERDGGEGRTEMDGPKGSGDWAFRLPTWAATPPRQVVLSDVLAQGKAHGVFGGTAGFHGGGSSSGITEIEGKPFQGSSNCCEARSPATNQMLQERSNQDSVGSSGTKSSNENMMKTPSEVENPSRKPHHGQNRGREVGSNSMEDMPCVFTQGPGPNGKRIEGILYRYGRGQEVRIMCVCHGNFLSPAEFVKHAGGGDVAHPLRHIVVNPSSTPYL